MSSKHPFSPVVRWTPSLARLRALSIRQPWAWLIVNGMKDIENRSFRTLYRDPLLIHAGLNLAGYTEKIELVKRKYGISVPLEPEVGGIVGVADVIDCEKSHESQWLEKGYSRFPIIPCGKCLVFKRFFQ